MQCCTYYRIDKKIELPVLAIGWGILKHWAIASPYMYSPPRPKGTVFRFFHGYFDHVGLYGHLIEYLLRENFSVGIRSPRAWFVQWRQSFDQEFHRVSDDTEACLAICKEQNAGPGFAVRQSTGAAVLIETLFQRRYTLEASPSSTGFFLAPLVRPKGWRSVVLPRCWAALSNLASGLAQLMIRSSFAFLRRTPYSRSLGD